MRMLTNFLRCVVATGLILSCSSLLAAEILTKELNEGMLQLETFHQAPSLNGLIEILDVLVPYYSSQPSSAKINTFTLAVLNKHPDYVAKIIQDQKTYSQPTQLYLANILNITQGGERKQLSRKITKLRYLKITKAPRESLDKLWAAFFATGDKRAVRKILRFINHDKNMLVFAHQYMIMSQRCHIDDRHACDALQTLNQQVHLQYSSKAATAFQEIAAIDLAIWSIEHQSVKHASVKSTISRLFKQEPHLNYHKNIEKKASAVPGQKIDL